MFKKSILLHNRYRKFVSIAYLDNEFLYSIRYFEISLTLKNRRRQRQLHKR